MTPARRAAARSRMRPHGYGWMADPPDDENPPTEVEMPPEPARPHAGPWRIEHPEHLTAPLLLAADDSELYYLERVSATAADDALVASAPTLALEVKALRLALEGAAEYITDVCGTDAVPVLAKIADILAATAPAAPGTSDAS